ncbi:TPA: hypothetical protein ACSUN1_000585 [Salmonella enterica subsp. diarizonae]|nr:hypothetical protein [Salmonella enterica]HEA0390783.1 hypothetical protein [Salmonella enterica]
MCGHQAGAAGTSTHAGGPDGAVAWSQRRRNLPRVHGSAGSFTVGNGVGKEQSRLPVDPRFYHVVVFLGQDTVWRGIPEPARLPALDSLLCDAWCETLRLVDIPVYGRTRDNIFLLNCDAPCIQEQINRLTWHFKRYGAGPASRYRARSAGAGEQRLVIPVLADSSPPEASVFLYR